MKLNYIYYSQKGDNMKKILYFVCIMLFGVSIKASPVVDVQYQEGIYSNRIGNTLYSGKMAFIFLDNNIVYCLDPFELVGKTYYEDNSFLNRFNKYDIEYMELAAYYGYNETNRKNIYYYMAAQELIWERIIGGNNVYWTTEDKGLGTKIDIEKYKKEILTNIDNFYKLPSFNNIFLKAPIFENQFIVDQNNILNSYEVISSGNNIIQKFDNELQIKFLDMDEQNIFFNKKLKTDNKTTVYTGTGNQTLARFGIDMEMNGKFTVQATDPYRTKLNLTLYDKETNEKINNAKFEVCSIDDIKMNSGWINNDGTYTYNDKFNEGKYYLCTVPDGYIYTDNLIFEINKDQFLEETNIDLYLEKEKIIPSNPVIDEKPMDEVKEEIQLPIKEESMNETINVLPVPEESVQQNNQSNIVDEEIIVRDLQTLPNTNNYNLTKYVILFLLFIIGLISYEIQNNRN